MSLFAVSDGAVERSLVLDPRTKLVLLVVVSTVLILSSNEPAMIVVRTVVIALPFAFLAVSGRVGVALVMAVLYVASIFLSQASAFMPPALEIFVLMNCMVVARFLPTLVMGYFIMSTTTVSEFMAGMQRMHMPNWLTVPLSVLFRFFPTLLEEARSINAAMRMRGLGLAEAGPLAMVEYRLVPLMACAVDIGEELSASALTRGLDAEVPRTSVCEIGFGALDVALIAVSLACLAALVADWTGVAALWL